MKQSLLFAITVTIGVTLATAWPRLGAAGKPTTTVLTYHYIHGQRPKNLTERYFVVTPQQLTEHLGILTQFHYPAILLLRKNDPETTHYVEQFIKPIGILYLWYTTPTYRTFTPENLAAVLPSRPPPDGSYPVTVKEVSGTVPMGDFDQLLPNRHINADCFPWRENRISCASIGTLLGVLVFSFGLLSLSHPLLSSAFLIAFLPWYPIRLVLFGLPLTLLELLMLSFILARGQHTWVLCSKLFRFSIPTILLVLTLGVTLLSFSSPIFSASGLGYARAFIVIPIVWMLSLLLVFKRVEDLYWPIYGYIVASTIVGILALLRYVLGDAYLHFDGQVRATFFGNPNHLASFLNSGLLLSLGMLVILKRRLFLLTTIIVAVVLWLTVSKGALLGVGAAVFYLFVAPRIPHRLTDYLPALVVAIFGATLAIQLAIATQGRYVDTAGNQVRTILSSNASRFAVYQTSMLLLNNSPIFGIGLANFRDRFRQTVSAASPEQDTAFAHNIFLDIWLQLGIVGIYVFFLWIAGAFRYPGEKTSRTLVLFLQAALLARLTHGMVDSVLLKNDFAVITIFLIGALWWLNRHGQGDHVYEGKERR